MVLTFGNNIKSAFTAGKAVKAIYTNGVLVWPVEPKESYYVHWTPASGYISPISTTFKLGGIANAFSRYTSGYFYQNNRWSNGIIDSSAFYSNSRMTAFETNCIQINENAFAYCTSLSTVSLYDCVSLGSSAFMQAKVTNLNAPKCGKIGYMCFEGCPFITISLPACTSVSNYAFSACRNLKNVYLPKCANIQNNAFQGCTSLQSFYIGKDLSRVANLMGSSVFYNTNSTFKIYVPASLVNAYKSATNWISFSSRIFPQ